MSQMSKMKLASWILLGVGLALNITAQIQGTRSGTPDAMSRTIWSIVPFVVLAFALWRLARSRAHDIVVIVGALVLTLSFAMYTDDEMRLTYSLTPVLQLGLVLLLVAILTVDGWRLRRRDRRASPG